MTLTNFLVPTYVQMLGALSAWLDKTVAQRPRRRSKDAAFRAPRPRHVSAVYPSALRLRAGAGSAFRLRGEAFPASIAVLSDEGRNAGERPGTIEDALARISETVAAVKAAAADALPLDPATPIAHALPQGMVFDLTAEQYARDWALPQFYFHVMTAYAILRAQGVELGKADYVAHMYAYLRQGTLPSN